MLQRGIDPNVDDPTQIHVCNQALAYSLSNILSLQSHTEVPIKDEDWPSVGAIIAYQSRVRERILKIYEDIKSGQRTLTRKVARVLFLTLEHEALHAEVSIQRRKVLKILNKVI